MVSKVAIGLVSAVTVTVFVVGLGAKIAMSKADEVAKDSVSDLVNMAERASEGKLRITYGPVSNSLIEREIIVKDVAFKMIDGTTVFEVDSVGLTAEGGVKGEKLPHTASLSLHGVQIVDENALDNIRRKWGDNFGSSPLDVAVGYSYNGAGDVITPTFSFSGAQLPGVDATLAISNVRGIWNVLESNYASKGGNLDFDRDDKRTLDKLGEAMRLNRAEFTYTNNGELDAWLEGQVKNARSSMEEFRQELPEAVEYHLGGKPYAPDVLAFFLEPNNISVSVDPERPMAMQDVFVRLSQFTRWQVSDAVGDLDIKVKANQSL